MNLILEQRHGKTVARSTLYRHLKAAGATRSKLGILQEPVRKRWTCAHTHELWVGDFADGPCVLLQGLSVRTYLSAFIDAHSRYVVAARYYLRESLDVLCDTLTPQRWPFAVFAACLAELLGRAGGLTAFSAEELDALRQVHERQNALTRTRLKRAFLHAGQKSIPAIVYALQTLLPEE